ncbi:MAG: hypothetical protein ACREKB_10730 [Candidatus Rokuibacteriota bacterium]
MKRDLVSGILLIAGYVAMLVVMSFHPTGHNLVSPERFAGLARINVTVHALAVATIPVLFLGLLGLTRRLGSSDLTVAALVAWGFGGVAVTIAAVANGFVATGVVGRMLAVGDASRDVYHVLLTYTSLVNRSFANVHVVAMSVAILLWSAATLRSLRMGRAVGIAGVVAGAGILLGFFSGHLRMTVHGFGIVVLAHAAWLIWLGILLCRPGPPPASAAGGAP